MEQFIGLTKSIKMKIIRFKKLSKEKQLEILLLKKPIGCKKENSEELRLYRLDEFFVELKFDSMDRMSIADISKHSILSGFGVN